jgi:hypothetical protein
VVTTPLGSRIEAFALFESGPTYAGLVRLGLVHGTKRHLVRAAVALAAVAWLSPLLLCLASGRALQGATIPFLLDFAVHARFLLALPLLVMAQTAISPRIAGAIGQFLRRGMVAEKDAAAFESALDESSRLGNSRALESALLAAALFGSFLMLGVEGGRGASSWDRHGVGGSLTPAGWWYRLVSVPLFQFVFLRWVLKLLVWARFLGLVARLDLKLLPTHPDRAAGLAFLGAAHRALGVLGFAAGILMCGRFANDVVYAGATLQSFRGEVVVMVVLIEALVLGPLVQFAPRMLHARRAGLAEYGALAQDYVAAFDSKWVRGRGPDEEPLLGSGDIQSLADLGNSFQMVQQMRVVPFDLKDVMELAILTLAPLVPLLTMVMPLDQILRTVFKLLA